MKEVYEIMTCTYNKHNKIVDREVDSVLATKSEIVNIVKSKREMLEDNQSLVCMLSTPCSTCLN